MNNPSPYFRILLSILKKDITNRVEHDNKDELNVHQVVKHKTKKKKIRNDNTAT